MYHEPTCLVEKKDKHMLVGLCRFFVVLIYLKGTYIRHSGYGYLRNDKAFFCLELA